MGAPYLAQSVFAAVASIFPPRRSCSWPPTASSPAGATSTSSTWSWPSLARSRLSSTSSLWCGTTSDLLLPTRPLVICLPSMRRCRQLHLRLPKRRPPHPSTTSPRHLLPTWFPATIHRAPFHQHQPRLLCPCLLLLLSRRLLYCDLLNAREIYR